MKIARPLTFNAAKVNGFTLTELLVLVVTFAILGGLLLPALAGTKPNSAAFQCLQNQRQMVRAWQMYADDNGTMLVASLDQGGSGFFNGRPVWMKGNAQSSPYNWDVNTLTNSPLYNYVGKSPSLFKCPADSTMWAVGGKAYPSIRSISMNLAFGGAGQWLPATKYRIYAKWTEIVKPTSTFVFIDENPASINDGNFAVECDPATKDIIDIPANYHDRAAGLSFADGHAVLHKWTGPIISTGSFSLSYSSADAADWQYLADNTTVLK
jgi:type II secretory pathway pseudopilin PulG